MDYTTLRILRILQDDASVEPEQIAIMLGLEADFVRQAIARLEQERVVPASFGRRSRAWTRGVRRASYFFGTGLVIMGVALLLSVGALYAYGAYERLRFEREVSETPTVAAPALAEAEEIPETSTPVPTQPIAQPWVDDQQASEPTPAPLLTATATASPTSTPTPVILPARRIIIPKIKLDSRVVEAAIKDGQWQVPKFVAGHLEGTANPGEPGNVVLSGHVQSISSGNVFANIDRLQTGDRVTLLTEAAEFWYVVKEKRVVRNEDLSVVAPTSEETLTLITCTGTFQPATKDYDKRLVVIARRALEVKQERPATRSQ